MPLNRSAAARIHAVLERGEEIHWLGHPQMAEPLRQSFWKRAAFFLLLGVVCLWLFNVDPERRWLWEPLFWVFSVLSLFTWISRFWMPWLLRSGIAYAMTDRRVLLAGMGPKKPLRSFTPDQLREMVCLEENDGTGSLIFDPTGDPTAPFDPNLPGIFNIPEPRVVEELIRRTLLDRPPEQRPVPFVEAVAQTDKPQPDLDADRAETAGALGKKAEAPPPQTSPPSTKNKPTSKDHLIGALESDERVLWLGAPQSLFARKVPFGRIALVCFLLGLCMLALESLDPDRERLYHGGRSFFWFAAFINGFMVFPLRYPILRNWVTYAITDRRVLISSEFFAAKVRSWQPDELDRMTKLVEERHWDCLLFEPAAGWLFALRSHLPGFLFLQDAQQPEGLIRHVLLEKQPIPPDVRPVTMAELRYGSQGSAPLPPARTLGQKAARGLMGCSLQALGFGCIVLCMFGLGWFLNWVRGPDHHFKSVCFSADGKKLFGVRSDRTVFVWDAETGQMIHQSSTPEKSDGNRNLYPLPDSVWYLDTPFQLPPSKTRTLEFHNAATGELRLTLEVPGGWGVNRFMPDGKTLVTLRGASIQLWDVTTKQVRQTLQGPENVPKFNFNAVDFPHSAKRLVTTDSERFLRVWDLKTGKELFGIPTHSGSVGAVRVHPDGTKAATAGAKPRTGRKAPTRGEVKLWDLEKREEIPLTTFEFGDVSVLYFSPNGKLLAAADYRNNLKVWEVATGKEIFSPTEKGSHGYYDLDFSPDGRLLAAGSPADEIIVWDVATWTVKHKLK